jgi:hypothetical protein
MVRVIRDQLLHERQQQLRVVANAVGDADLEGGIPAKDFCVCIKRQLTDAVQADGFRVTHHFGG